MSVMLTSFFSYSNTRDVLILNNGMIFSVEILKVKNCVVIAKSENKKYFVPADEIKYLHFADTTSKANKERELDINTCLLGTQDADLYHGKGGGHFALGAFFGVFSLIGTLNANPDPYNGRYTGLRSKNKEYFNDPEYLACYRKKAKAKLLGAEALGWSAFLLFWFVVI